MNQRYLELKIYFTNRKNKSKNCKLQVRCYLVFLFENFSLCKCLCFYVRDRKDPIREFYYSRFVDDHSIILFTMKDIEITFCLSLSYTSKFKFPGFSTFRIKLRTSGTLNLLPFIFVRYFEETKKRFDSFDANVYGRNGSTFTTFINVRSESFLRLLRSTKIIEKNCFHLSFIAHNRYIDSNKWT